MQADCPGRQGDDWVQGRASPVEQGLRLSLRHNPTVDISR
jgi:hypothetical protein